jgi:hypothetical protein
VADQSHDAETTWFCKACVVALAFSWWGVLGGGVGAYAQQQPRDILQFIRQQPMIFFVAKGEPGACGPDCSEWIAAEGGFDQEVHVRLRQFLGTLPRIDLPIFFHSRGGIVGPSLAVGAILRAHRMRAGVGHTIPVGCRDTLSVDEACRKLMQSGREFKSRLRESGATCASSCVYALIGASTRTIAYVARVGVHRHRALQPQDQVRLLPGVDGPVSEIMVIDRLKQYVTRMGIDFGLIDVAERTDATSMHWLSRDDLARLGVLTDGRFETRWVVHARRDGHFVAKSVTQPSRRNPAEYRTATIEFGCSLLLTGHTSVSIRRDLDPVEARDGATVRMTFGDNIILNSERRSVASIDVRATSVPADVIAQVAASNGIVLKELSETWTRETKFSTQGLWDALQSAPEDCRKKD